MLPALPLAPALSLPTPPPARLPRSYLTGRTTGSGGLLTLFFCAQIPLLLAERWLAAQLRCVCVRQVPAHSLQPCLPPALSAAHR